MQPVVQFVSNDSGEDVGGVSTWLRKAVPWLREHGIDARVVLFCSGDTPGVNADWYRKMGVPVRCSQWPDNMQRAVQQCLAWLRDDKPQVYVPNCILPAYFAAAEARRCGARTIGVLHSDDPYYWGLVDEFVLGGKKWRLDEVVVVSKFLNNALRGISPIEIPVHEIPYGVTIPHQCVARPTGLVRIIYTGRLVEEQKRISDLARALCRVARDHPSLEAWIVGSGPDEESVRSIIQEEGMERSVILKGRVDNESIYSVLRECHLFVLLSDYEGTPVSLLEAMAVGLVPICLKTHSGVGEIISHMKNGILVLDRVGSFSEAVAQMVGDQERWLELSSAARQTIFERYSAEVCYQKWRDLLLAGSPAAPFARQPRLTLKLPPRNPKFGNFDQRHRPFLKRVLSFLRVKMRRIYQSVAASSTSENEGSRSH